MNKPLDTLAIDTIRALAMDAVQAANSGHPGTPMALAPLGHLLFTRLRKHHPEDPAWCDRDRFVLSCGHASMLQYALLHLTGYAVSLDDLRAFRQWQSLTPGHPEFGHTPGVETTTGPLGQGLANAVGMAMAERHLAARFNRPGFDVVDHRTWVVASDGDLMEGVASEASSLAGHLGLGKLIVFWDDNRITIDGATDLSFSEDVLLRYRAYGWHVARVEDGNDLEAIETAAGEAMLDPRPSLVAVRTVIGFPSPGKSGSSDAHGAPLGADEVEATRAVMGWPGDPFFVPRELAEVARRAVHRGAEARAAWEGRFQAYREVHPELARQFEAAIQGALPEGWDERLAEFPASAKGMATRKASGAVLAELSQVLPNLVGGSADLAGSNNSWQKGKAAFHERDAEGPPCNVHFGVREHAMAAICNGLALHGGVIPYAATFFVFSDYMRPAIRLAALMNLPVRYIFTHDSIGVGEDGPTHQPVEHLAALRAIRNLVVMRPADANEVRECYRAGMRRQGPVAMVLTRQDLPVFDRTQMAPAAGAARGAYVLRDARGGPAEAILIATGSEVALALAAQDQLAARGIRARVVSMPSWELFAEEDPLYQESVLPGSIAARVVVEAGIRMGWERWAGSAATYVAMETYGASAPASELFRRFGFTPELVCAAVERAIALAGLRPARHLEAGEEPGQFA